MLSNTLRSDDLFDKKNLSFLEKYLTDDDLFNLAHFLLNFEDGDPQVVSELFCKIRSYYLAVRTMNDGAKS